MARFRVRGGELFHCQLCSYKSSSRAGLAGHMKHAHKQVDEVRWLVAGTSCPCCNMEFESRERIVRHLQCNGSLLCRVFVFENCNRVDDDVFESLEKSSRSYQALLRKQGKDRHYCEKRPFPKGGPLHPKSFFHLSRCERISLLKEIAANIDGKSYDSRLGCVWKVGSGTSRRVRGGTGSSGVCVGRSVGGVDSGGLSGPGSGLESVSPIDNGMSNLRHSVISS